jgi:nucleoid-associated protein YgaU
VRCASGLLAVACGIAASVAAAREAAAESLRQVKPGDTLWSIAAEEFGDGAFWLAVYRANRDQIKDPRVLHPGQELAIPDVPDADREALLRQGRRGVSSPPPQ